MSTALALFIIMGFAALTVDMGVMYTARTDAQAVADAASMAGAFTFISNPTSPQPQTAVDHAIAVATANTLMDRPVQAADVDVTVDVDNRIVTADIRVRQDTVFAKVLSFNEANIAARGVAEAAPNASGTLCAKPWFLPNTVLSSKEPCAVGGACASGELLIGPDKKVTAFAQAYYGQQITVKPNSPSKALAPGQFFAAQLWKGPGGAGYKKEIETCVDVATRCSECYPVKTGNMIGPTVQGANDLIGSPPDIYVSVGQYRRSDGSIRSTSPSLVAVPIWDSCDTLALNCAGAPQFCPSGVFPNGSTVSISVIGFAMIFIERANNKDGVVGRLVGIQPCGADPGYETGPYSVPLRLIRRSGSGNSNNSDDGGLGDDLGDDLDGLGDDLDDGLGDGGLF